MNIKKIKTDSALTLIPEGRLDSTTAPELDGVLKSGLDGITDLTFDFSGLEYISSAGLRVLLSAQKVMSKQGEMRVIGANEIVREVFDITGFSEMLTIE